jgi:hypothetical protein
LLTVVSASRYQRIGHAPIALSFFFKKEKNQASNSPQRQSFLDRRATYNIYKTRRLLSQLLIFILFNLPFGQVCAGQVRLEPLQKTQQLNIGHG